MGRRGDGRHVARHRLRGHLAGDGATGTILAVNNLVAGILNGFASDAQKREWLVPVARGDMLGAFCLTEPQAGSDVSAITTRAERVADGWALNGVKQFITSGKTADVAIVFAVTDKAAGKRGIYAIIVPTKAPGYVVARALVEQKAGQHASDTAQVVFEDCRIPAANLLADEGIGYRIALANLESGRINIAAQATGIARSALEAAVGYVRARRSFDRPLIEPTRR